MASVHGSSPSGESARASTSQEPFPGDEGPLPNLNRREQADSGDGEVGTSDGTPSRKKAAGGKRSASGAVKLDKNGNPKKKRKQLV